MDELKMNMENLILSYVNRFGGNSIKKQHINSNHNEICEEDMYLYPGASLNFIKFY